MLVAEQQNRMVRKIPVQTRFGLLIDRLSQIDADDLGAEEFGQRSVKLSRRRQIGNALSDGSRTEMTNARAESDRHAGPPAGAGVRGAGPLLG
jgi:hypothetical protein